MTTRTRAGHGALLGVQSDAAALEKLQRAARRMGASAVHVQAEGERGARVVFEVRGYRVERTHARLDTYEANLSALALWLENRAKEVTRGVESPAEAFGDCLAGRPNGAPVATPCGGGVAAKTIEESIEVFIGTLARLEIPQRDVKVTWDTSASWARLRLRLPSGRIVDKHLVASSAEVAVAALALWLQGRARGWERGWESPDLDVVFAGNLAATGGA